MKIAAFVFISVTFFYLGKHWSDGYQQLVFFTTNPQTSSVSVSPNNDKSFNVSYLIAENSAPPPPPPPGTEVAAVPPPPPAPDSIQRFGIVDENGNMADEFEVGEFDPEEVVEDWGIGNGTEEVDNGGSRRVRVKRFELCASNMREYIPCLDNQNAIKKLKSTERGERFERHCPEPGRGLNCLVPPPKDYKTPIPWPKSRDEVLEFGFFVSVVPLPHMCHNHIKQCMDSDA